MNTVAIDIGGTKFSVALFQERQMVRRESRTTDREGGRDWMLAQLASLLDQWRREGLRWQRCGTGFGGPVLFGRQVVALSTHVGGWSDFPLVEWLRETAGVPVVMDNDANAGALGEAVHGAGRGFDPLFYMTLSTGIGGGIVIGGRPYRGADSMAGELGHAPIVAGGPECLCGAHGCFERICSGLWLERDHGRPAEVLLQDAGFAGRYVIDLARGLKIAIMLLNPARIVVGGGISKAGERLFGPLRAELRRQITEWSRASIDVVPAALGDDSVLYGGLALAAQEFP